jgi:hypothetical protein
VVQQRGRMRVRRWLRRCVGLLALIACGFAVLLGASVGVARADEIHYEPHGLTFTEDIADNYAGEREPEKEVSYTLPAGRYAETLWSGSEDGAEEYEERCETGNIFYECVGLHKVVKRQYEGELPAGYHKLEHLAGEAEYEGIRSVGIGYFAWKPGRRRHGPRRSEMLGLANGGEPNMPHPCKGDPVNCETGNLVESQRDIAVPALGVPFVLERTYNSQAAVEKSPGDIFGNGWSSSFSDHLEINSVAGEVAVVQANGSTVTFFGEVGPSRTFTGPAWSQATLVSTSEGLYKYTLPDQETFTFNSTGRLLSETERNGNTTTVTYNEEEVCESECHKILKSIVITDPAGRKITLTLNSSGEVGPDGARHQIRL